MNKTMSEKDFLSAIIRYGCRLVSIKGSHFKVENLRNGRRTTIPVHAGRDMQKYFAKDLLEQLEIDIDDFMNTL